MDAKLKGELAAAVKGFFAALDSRDLERWRGGFTRGARIVHADGRATSPAAFAGRLREAPPLRRSLSRFRSGGGPALAWVSYANRVSFAAAGELVFSETALLRKERGAWRFLRVHYSGGNRA